jgi:hypothetical protein
MPVTLTTWEAKIGKVAVGGQPEQIVCETPFPKNNQIEMG